MLRFFKISKVTVEPLRTDLQPIRKHLGFGFKASFQPHNLQLFAVAKSRDRHLHEINYTVTNGRGCQQCLLFCVPLQAVMTHTYFSLTYVKGSMYRKNITAIYRFTKILVDVFVILKVYIKVVKDFIVLG